MSKIPIKEDFWPDHRQELLLKAALLQGKESIMAWEEWKGGFTTGHNLEKGSLGLLPMLYKNLNAQGIKDPLLKVFNGIYRRTWYKNEILLRNAIPEILSSFDQAGIKVMVLQAAALVRYYRDSGLRSLEDFDVLVPIEIIDQAIQTLGRSGWQIAEGFMPITKLTKYSDHSRRFVHSDHSLIMELHWYAFPERCCRSEDDDLWGSAIKVQVANREVWALNATDKLLYICAYGTRYSMRSSLYWVMDSFTLLKDHQGEIDWQRLLSQAKKRSLNLHLREALNYLEDEFKAPIPEFVMKNINSMKIPDEEMFHYKRNTQKPPFWELPFYTILRGLRLMHRSLR